ncbi:MAG: DUF1254 domain-containing protein [Proteobacteria bacterium]|nr:DUF1254 domain-containing protein [Pseudomonadota bacterium]
MKATRRWVLGAALSAPALARAQEKPMLEELARRAAIYLFPVYEMYRTRWNATVDEKNRARQQLNHILHVPTLATHRSRAVTTPNADTLYSSAWLDLSVEPVFLTVPDMGGRYYSFAFMSLFTDNFACVSRRLDGNRPGPRMIVGPSWKGVADRDVEMVRAPTNSVWLLGRILVDGPPDQETVWTLQSRVLLESPDMRNERRILETQELMRQRTTPPPEPVADWPRVNPGDPFDLFEVGMRALGESPLGERDKTVLEDFAPLRLRPGRKYDLRAFSEIERESIKRGIIRARDEIRNPGRQFGTTINGWSYPQRNLGNFGDDYLYRAVIALTGLAALEVAEATYLMCSSDAEGQPFDGRNRYLLRFEPGRLPPAGAFWSLSMYEVTPEGRAFFTDNPIGRYAIGDRTHGLVHGPDGALEIHLQHDRPDEGREANWLPAPAGPMRLVLRAYEPAGPLIDASWQAPAVKRVS